jgi:glutathione S-transferase
MPQLKLTYFDAPGRAEPIRVALHLAGIDFEDHRVQFPEFAALKSGGGLPLGSVPVLEVDGCVFAQTAAILRPSLFARWSSTVCSTRSTIRWHRH